MVDGSLVVFEAPDQTGEMHFRACASGLLHDLLKNIKAFVRLRLACLSGEVGVVPPHSHNPLPSSFLGPSCASRTRQLPASFIFHAILPLMVCENLLQVRLFLLGDQLAAVMLQPGTSCLCCTENQDAAASTAVLDLSVLV